MSQKLPFTEDVMFVLFQSCLYHMRSKLTHLGIRKMQYFEEILFWWSIEINKANLKCLFIRTVDFSRSKLYINHNTASTSYQINNWSSIMDWQFNYGFSVWRIACLIYIQGFSMPQEGLVIYIIDKIPKYYWCSTAHKRHDQDIRHKKENIEYWILT